MNTDRLRPVIGNWANDDAFFDRVEESDILTHRLRQGASVVLSAPRRVGKTSLLREVERRLSGERTCLFVDLESCSSAEDAIAAIADAAHEHQGVRERATSWLRSLAGHAELDGPAKVRVADWLRAGWQHEGRRLLKSLTSGDRPVVLFLDEASVLLAAMLRRPAEHAHGPEQAEALLGWLREQVQVHRGVLSVVVTGSIGLQPLLQRAGLSATLNAYQPFSLEPWDGSTSRAALHALSAWEGLTLEESAAEHAYRRLGVGVPYHVQLLHQALAEDRMVRAKARIEVEDVDRAWARLLERPAADLPHWRERLRQALPAPELAVAESILAQLAHTEPRSLAKLALEPAEAALAPDIITLLEHDGYLGRSPQGLYFPNRLLRAWWRRLAHPDLAYEEA